MIGRILSLKQHSLRLSNMGNWRGMWARQPVFRKAGLKKFAGQVDIQEASEDIYAAVIDGKLAVKIGAGNWEPGQDLGPWRLEHSGPNYAVWLTGHC